MSATGEDGVPIPLRLDLEYVDATTDACFAWLKEKYAHLTAVAPSASTIHTAAPLTSTDPDSSDEAKKKPKLSTADLQSIENDLLACDALRWRVFAFPSHPTNPLNSSYRNEPGKKGGSASLTAELHKVKKGKKQTKDTAIGSDEGKTDGVEGSPCALFIRTRATAEMKKREKKERLAATAAAAAAGKETSPAAAAAGATQSPPVKVQALLEKVVRDEEEARWCRILGEERVPLRSLTSDGDVSSVRPSMWSWFPRSWRPQLGGYVSAPSRKDSARLLLFPQARHPPVDVRDPAAKQFLSDPQPVPWYLRGSVNWDVEKHNPAANTFAVAEASSADRVPNVSGLSYSVQAAQVRPAPTDNNYPHNTLHPHNWADVVEVSVAAQQSRTERQYASAREKVQRVTLTEDAAAVKISQGNPRYSVSLSAAHTTVQNSGVRHQQEAAANGFTSAGKTKQKRQHRHSASFHASPPSTDDTIQHLQLQDAYDSTVQNFPLPRFWQRLVQPSQRPSTTTTAATNDADEERGVGTAALKNVPRGQYRVRWSGGPGVELCSAGAAAGAESTQQPEVWWTVFGKLWTESWIEVPLPWRLALKLRTQTAITMPLELSTPLALPMVPGAPATVPPGEAGSGAHSWLREHPYFWATQGPRWDAALVRGFKNDYSGMHHARRWYSILSAELTMSGAGGRKGGKHGKVSSSTSVDGASRAEVDEETSEAAAPAGRWSNTSLTAFANACVVDTLRDYPRASVGFSLTSKIPRLAITPFNEMIPHTFECSFSWFAAFKSNNTGSDGGDGGNGFSVELRSGMEQQQGGSAAAVSSNGAPFLRVSPVETFHHMKCGLTWRFDE